MNRDIERMFRQIENCLIRIDEPAKCRTDLAGYSRTILPDSKIREAKQLYEKIAKAELLIINQVSDEEEFVYYQDWLNRLEAWRQSLVSPMKFTPKKGRNLAPSVSWNMNKYQC